MALAAPEIRDLGAAPADLDLLRAFYERLYVPAFPDADERESLANIERYLELRSRGWYGANNYRVRVLLDGAEPVGGAIADYLAGPNVGVIEFLVVAPGLRGRDVGRRLFEDVEAALAADARAAGAPGLRAVVAEMNDPFRWSLAHDSMDPFDRLLIWSRWGFSKLDFPYVQPALSTHQRPVPSMLLAWKPLGEAAGAVAAGLVKHVVHEYVRWAMRIEDPGRSTEFAAMARYLDGHAEVGLVPLDRYVGHDGERPFVVDELATDDPDLDAVRVLYAVHFRDSATAVDAAALGRVPVVRRSGEHAYHLWALRLARGAPVAGLASFFTLPEAGFGGYVALAPPLRGTGRLPLLLSRIETQMIRDRLGAAGWYVECGDAVLGAFLRLGFHEVPVAYRQPPLRPGEPAAALHLLYKTFGRAYAPPTLSGAALLAALRRILRVVYAVERPEDEPSYRDVARAVDASGAVPLR
jgi:GNAT superfamily N-acetyltransferase